MVTIPNPLRGAVSAVLDRFFLHGTVVRLSALTPDVRLVTVQGDELRTLKYVPGQQVRLAVVDLSVASNWTRPNDAVRTYSIWNYTPESGTAELAVFDHGGDTAGTRWSRALAVGDEVTFGSPEGNVVVVPDARSHLFVSDETGIVPSGAIIRSLPAEADIVGVFESTGPAHRIPLSRELRSRVDVVRVPSSSVSPSPELVDAVRALDLPRGTDHRTAAYLTGEAKTVSAVRRYLVNDLGWNRKHVRTKAFWTPGKKGME